MNHLNASIRQYVSGFCKSRSGKAFLIGGTHFCTCNFLTVVLQFETSGKWPDDLTAIQHIKAAFHIRLAELLRTECSLVTAASAKHVDVQKVRNVKILLFVAH